MWEAIRSNQQRSLWLITWMGVVLVVLGAVIGLAIAMYVTPVASAYASEGDLDRLLRGMERPLLDQVLEARAGIYFGVAGAVLLWLILWGVAVGSGDRVLLRSAQAREISKADAPQLWNIVEEMTIASGKGRMPRVFIIDDASMNAFAVGYHPDRAAVAVTAGLLKRLNRDELQGVIAHEIGHIRNADVKFMTLAGVMVGAIILVSQVFLRGMFYGSVGRRRSSSRDGGGAAQIVVLVVAILVAVLAPLAAQLLYFACSRRREYLADASAARFTRYPPGLANALEKIARRPGLTENTNKVVAPMYIVNPLQARAAFSLFSTHPPTEDRIRILRGMAGAGFAAYEEAFRRAHRGQTCIGPRTLSAGDAAAIRTPSPAPAPREAAIARAQEVENLLDRVVALLIIPCVCGAKLKLPPDLKRESITCPRCGRQHHKRDARRAEAPAPPPPAEPLRYRRQGAGWETFPCGACGHMQQLSPKFAAPQVTCKNCRQTIQILPPEG